MYVDKAGRYWLWSEATQSNLAVKAMGRDACLLEAIDMLLFMLKLKDERIAEQKAIVDLALQFADKLRA